MLLAKYLVRQMLMSESSTCTQPISLSQTDLVVTIIYEQCKFSTFPLALSIQSFSINFCLH